MYHDRCVVRHAAILLGVGLVVACRGNKREEAPDQELAQHERTLDEKERDLDRRLSELATRPLDAAGSRSVPAEKGVPLDKRLLGAAPHPFGPLEVVTPGMTRDEVIAAVPAVQRDGAKLAVPSGIEDVTIELGFDDAGRLATASYTLGAGAREVLLAAWGQPSAGDTSWLDVRRRWRADLSEQWAGTSLLAITAITPVADIVGRGPDGLAEKRALIGATHEQLRVWFGDRLREPGDSTDALALVMPPASDVCGRATELDLELPAVGKVTRLELVQCFDGDDGRRAALAAFEQRWGRATPARTADDRLVFAWQLPGRRLQARAGDAAWRVTITAK